MTPKERNARDARLARRARSGDAAATAELVGLYDKLAWKTAHRYRSDWLDVDDLAQEARLGLLDAIEQWDPERGTFLTVAAMWCRTRVSRALRGVDAAVTSMRHDAVDLDAACGLASTDTAEEQLEREEQYGFLHECLRELDLRSRYVLERLFFAESDALTLAEVAAELGISRSLVQKIKTSALTQLNALLKEAA